MMFFYTTFTKHLKSYEGNFGLVYKSAKMKLMNSKNVSALKKSCYILSKKNFNKTNGDQILLYSRKKNLAGSVLPCIFHAPKYLQFHIRIKEKQKEIRLHI